MADDAHEERFRQHEAMLQGLARIWDAQHAMNQEQRELNQRLTLAIERIDQTMPSRRSSIAMCVPPWHAWKRSWRA